MKLNREYMVSGSPEGPEVVNEKFDKELNRERDGFR